MNNIDHEKILNILIRYKENINNDNIYEELSQNFPPGKYIEFTLLNNGNGIKKSHVKCKKHEIVLYKKFYLSNASFIVSIQDIFEYYLKKKRSLKKFISLKKHKKPFEIYNKYYDEYVNYRKKIYQSKKDYDKINKYNDIKKKCCIKYHFKKNIENINIRDYYYENRTRIQLNSKYEYILDIEYKDIHLIKINLKKTYRKHGLLIPKNIKKELFIKTKN